jgi:hypothetical protein
VDFVDESSVVHDHRSAGCRSSLPDAKVRDIVLVSNGASVDEGKWCSNKSMGCRAFEGATLQGADELDVVLVRDCVDMGNVPKFSSSEQLKGIHGV